jgi:hypothetical protein
MFSESSLNYYFVQKPVDNILNYQIFKHKPTNGETAFFATEAELCDCKDIWCFCLEMEYKDNLLDRVTPS